MNRPEKTHFPAKLLLLGEHTVLKGSQALAVPFPVFKGYWAFCEDKDRQTEKQRELPQLLSYLQNLQGEKQLLAGLQLDPFKQDLDQGLYFESDIPSGYGLGSSGALCAAIYQRYTSAQTQDLSLLKKQLAQIESFFHGSSSGIDPLIISLNQPVLINRDKSIQTATFRNKTNSEKPAFSFFLLDTGISRQTAPFVNLFLKKCEKTAYLNAINQKLAVYTDLAIQHLLDNDLGRLFEDFLQISAFQRGHFEEMIPSSFYDVWEGGLESRDYALKLCGAGGGGFLLGMANLHSKALERLGASYKVITFEL